jgi:hypothetical protein
LNVKNTVNAKRAGAFSSLSAELIMSSYDIKKSCIFCGSFLVTYLYKPLDF